MASLTRALDEITPLLHAAMIKAARPTVPIEIQPHPHALATVPGSLEPYLCVEGAPELPYPNALAAALGDNALPAASPNSRGIRTSAEQTPTGGGEEAREGSKEVGALLPFNAPLWTSKVGGFGYLPKGFPYPLHATKKTPLQLFLQLNFSELHAQCAALAKHGDDGAENCFLPSPPWPTEGILAVYVDSFDHCWGCHFVSRDPQEGFRFLYFEKDYEEGILPLLKQHLAARSGSPSNRDGDMERLEERLAELMWTREEQYAVFEQARAHDKDLFRALSMRGSLSAAKRSEAEREALLAEVDRYCRVAWLLPHGTEAPTDHAKSGAGVESAKRVLPLMGGTRGYACETPRLWYGQAVDKECVVTVDTLRILRETAHLRAVLAKDPKPLLPEGSGGGRLPLMVPACSIEFNQLVLFRALRGPHGRELLQVILAASAHWKRLYGRLVSKAKEEAEQPATAVRGDALEEVDVRSVRYSSFLLSSLEKLKRSGEEETNGDNDDDDDAEDFDEEPGLFLDNQVGGYPSFTQEDPRYFAYGRQNGGFRREKEESPSAYMEDTSGMLVFPERRQAPSPSTEEDNGLVVERSPEDGAIIADLCLFQIGEANDVLMIGDAGIANGFISERDLRERRFDRAWLTYDCG